MAGGADPHDDWSTAALADDGEAGGAPERSAVRASLSPGRVVAQRYRLDRLLGEGGMGSVWAATHLVTHKLVALKLIKAGADRPDVRKRSLREARAACAVRHPNVVAVHDLIEDEAGPVLVMDLLEGETLADRLAREGRLSSTTALGIFLPVASAVAAAHALGIVHRDLKPANVFLAIGASQSADGKVEVKVLDFGVAKLVTPLGDESFSRMTDTGAVVGTPCYMAPEQAYGESDIDHRADVWALGIMLYQCLSGVLPTRADNFGQIFKIITTRDIPPIETVVPDLPPSLAALVGRMLDRDRAARPSDLREVTGTLASCLGVAPPELEAPSIALAVTVAATPSAERTAPARPWRRRGLFLGLLGACAAALLAAWFSKGPSSSGSPPTDSPSASTVTAAAPAPLALSSSATADVAPTEAPTATIAPSAAPSATARPRVSGSAAAPSAAPAPSTPASTAPAASTATAQPSKNLGSAVVKTPPF